MIISLDCETTGLDLAHGAMPFLVTTCDDEGVVRFWEWDVDPTTRRPEVPDGDLADIAELVDAADLIYLHNARFDARALATVGLDLPWGKVRDTLVASHLLATNHPHNLTDLCIEYLGVDIEPLEVSIKEVVRICRATVKREYPQWRVAREGLPDMPSVKGGSGRDEDKPWKSDMWLPRALAEAGTTKYVLEHWLTACSKYANADSEHTLPLGLELERVIRGRGLWAIYEHRLQLPRVACEMECCGVTAIGEYTEATIQQYGEYVAEAGDALVAIAADHGHDLELSRGAALNNNMREFFYDKLKLPKVYGKKTKGATLDKEAMAEYLATTDGDAHEFIRLLTEKRQHDTDLSYMEVYRRFWVVVPGAPGFFRIHPSLNPCGTDHLRWSSNSPNLQNVGKQEDVDIGRVSVRNCFGPAPGREWWSMDFQNIELRIPAYESGEEAMVELFEKPDDPPFFGSYHCLNASIVYPELFWWLAEKEGAFKRQYKSTEYQWCKNGGFALQYGCGERKADATFRRKGAYRLLKEKLPKVAALAQRYLEIAERSGCVETLPDHTVDPERGYPILASRTEDGRVLSTTPFNYHVSGTACWCKNTALIRCADQCAEWRAEGFDANVCLEVHDEIIFDFPRGAAPRENLPRAAVLKGLMEQSGEDLVPRIPTPVSVSYHDVSWAKEVSV